MLIIQSIWTATSGYSSCAIFYFTMVGGPYTQPPLNDTLHLPTAATMTVGMIALPGFAMAVTATEHALMVTLIVNNNNNNNTTIISMAP